LSGLAPHLLATGGGEKIPSPEGQRCSLGGLDHSLPVLVPCDGATGATPPPGCRGVLSHCEAPAVLPRFGPACCRSPEAGTLRFKSEPDWRSPPWTPLLSGTRK
jgi:hypothetical protein